MAGKAAAADAAATSAGADDKGEAPKTDDKAKADAGAKAGEHADEGAKGDGDGKGAGADEGKGGKAAADTGDKGKADAGAAGAPEKYALTVPDGGHLDKTDLPRIEKLAREANWTNEETQAYVDELNASMQATSAELLASLKADPDLGGDKLAETQRLAKLAIEKLRPEGHTRRDGFLRLLNRGGYINHPEVVAVFADLGKLFDEDGHVHGSSARQGKATTVSKMYDHPTSVAADKAGGA
jgi:hypothetical protein